MKKDRIKKGSIRYAKYLLRMGGVFMKLNQINKEAMGLVKHGFAQWKKAKDPLKRFHGAYLIPTCKMYVAVLNK